MTLSLESRLASQPKRVIFLMSDTGAGHRAAADAIRAAMDQRYPGQYVYTLVDVYRRYTPFPFTHLPEIYPRWVKWAGPTWGWGYRFTNHRHRGDLLMAVLHRLWRDGVRRMVREHPADVIVSVHALFSRPIMRALNQVYRTRPPFVTVVTDLISTHAFWYEPAVERCLVPTSAAYKRGLQYGLSPAQLRLTGMPVHPHFTGGLRNQGTARQCLGMHPTLPAVLLAGGGDGMGPVYAIARELNRRRLPAQLVIIAGRNRALQQQLQAVHWNQPTLIYPFVNNMPDLMAAADMIVTKAGPTTVSEACIAGLPVVLSGAVPGQEDGTADYIVAHHAGAYAPGPQRVAETVAAWLSEGPDGLARRAAHARNLGRPDAIWAIADEIHQQAQRGPVPANGHRSAESGLPPVIAPAPEDGWML